MQTACGPRGRCARSTPPPKCLPNASQTPPKRLPNASAAGAGCWALPGVRTECARSQSRCARPGPGSTAPPSGSPVQPTRAWPPPVPRDQPVSPWVLAAAMHRLRLTQPDPPSSGPWLIYWFHAGGGWPQSRCLAVPRGCGNPTGLQPDVGEAPALQVKLLPRRGGGTRVRTPTHTRAEVAHTVCRHRSCPRTSPQAQLGRPQRHVCASLLGHPESRSSAAMGLP